MSIGMRGMSALMLVAIMAVPVAHAATDKAHWNMDAETIRTQQAQIRKDAEARQGRYATLEGSKRRRLFEKQALVLRMLEGRRSMAELDEQDRIIVFNALESIAAIVNDDEPNRTICRRQKPVGSNRPVTLCRTVAELEAEKRAADHDHGRRDLSCSTAMMGPGGCQ
jgi:hypothetical protein